MSIELSEYLELDGAADDAEAAVREAYALLVEVWKQRPDAAYDHVAVAELLEELGDAAAALRWANTGAFRLLRDERVPAGAAVTLLRIRRSLRLDMGFTEDEYDLLAAQDDALDDDPEGD